MKYTLTSKSDSYLCVTSMKDTFYLLICEYEYSKQTYKDPKCYSKVIDINFRWLFCKFDLVIRKK